MKINGILSKHSGTNKVAFTTHPPLNDDMAGEIRRLLVQPAEILQGILIEVHGQIVTIHSAEFSPQMAKAVEELLTAAENSVRIKKEQAERQKQAEEDAKKKAMESAQRAFQVSVG